MATLKDIARKTGVSVMTVSRALNNPELVKEEVREKILKQISEMNYIPHQGARSLVTRKTGIVQVVTRLKTTDPYFLFLLAGIADCLRENQYALIIGDKYNMNYKSDGSIIMSLHEDEKGAFFQKTQSPCVLFGKTHEYIDYVDIDNELGLFTATEHLIELGHKHIAFLGIEPFEAFTMERLKGYRHAMQKYNLEVSIDDIAFCDNTIESARKAGEFLMHKNMHTAVVCASDVLAMGLMEAVRIHNKIVPDDVSIVGFDGVYLHEKVLPSLTTIKQPVYDIGRKLAEVLIDRINDNERKQAVYIFKPTLLLGNSTKALN